jgi:DNA-directed RNA polymerase subunit omega
MPPEDGVAQETDAQARPEEGEASGPAAAEAVAQPLAPDGEHAMTETGMAQPADGEGVEGDAEEDWTEDVESSYLQSKYTLVSVAAKRARQLLDGSPARVETLSEKPVTIALEELSQGKLYFERVRESR